jgi:hypothetical protein
MPIYLDVENLVFNKQLLDQNYRGGSKQFRIDWNIVDSYVHQEDDELISLAAMNMDEFEIEVLTARGLAFDSDKQYSSDFIAISRYGGALWEAAWLNCNETFAWHVNCDPKQKARAKEISEEMTMDVIKDLMDKGIDVFQTIKSDK